MRSVIPFLVLLGLCLSLPVFAQEADSSALETDYSIADVEPTELPATAEEEQEAPPEASYPSLLEEDEENEFDAEAVGLGAEYLSTLTAPPKRRLRTHEKALPTITESVKMEEAPPSPKLAALPAQTLPREVLSKRHGLRLALQRLPVKTSAVTEKRPVQVLPPLAPRKRAPQYRTQPIKQEVIQPIVSVQPMLHERVLTRTIMQPTLQKQPVIQPIITQPVLTREIHEQPITQQQMKYRNIVQTRIVEQPKIHEELKFEPTTAPKQTVEAKAAPYPGMSQPPKKHH